VKPEIPIPVSTIIYLSLLNSNLTEIPSDSPVFVPANIVAWVPSTKDRQVVFSSKPIAIFLHNFSFFAWNLKT
jgi:hypothetical protein